jgi:zinc/manganese transport system substrate-binding protein
MNMVINIGGRSVNWRGGVGLLASLTAAIATAACGPSTLAPPGSISVVASTSVYGDLAAQVAGTLAGGKVRVTSIITDPAADPHSYEASTRTELAISRADVIIENGGGYDDFVDRLRKATGTHAEVIDAVDLSGKAEGGSFNEHVWYDLPTVEKVVTRIAGALAARDKADAATFRSAATTLIGRLRALEADEARIKAEAAGRSVAVTEPVPLYLLTACGLVNRTPAQFSAAIENETDVPPRVLQDTLGLFTQHRVALLVYNAQTSSRATDEVRAAARDNGIPAVPVTETLPAGRTFLTWMRGNLAAVAGALGVPLT